MPKVMTNDGEILVAPFTDQGWTPFFVNAAGICAVVNVLNATKLIKIVTELN